MKSLYLQSRFLKFHTTWEIEKDVKTGLANFGIGKYDLSKTLVIDTERLCYVVFLINGIDFVLVHAHVFDVDAFILSVVFSFCSYRSLGVCYVVIWLMNLTKYVKCLRLGRS